VVDNTVSIGTDGGAVYAVDADSGDGDWAFTEPEGAVFDAPILAAGTVYAGSGDGEFPQHLIEGCHFYEMNRVTQ